MSYPSDAPAAAWYPDPQTSGQVRWWDGQNWTEHVSKTDAEAQPAAASSELEEPVMMQEATVLEATAQEATVLEAAAQEATVHEAAVQGSAVQGAHLATVTYIGRHAAGATPAPRMPSTAPRIRPRVRGEVATATVADSHIHERVGVLSYA